jgi:hypothetical protein
VVRRERPARATTPISAPQLDRLVDSLREPPPPTEEPAFELPDADDEVEMSVTEHDPAAPRPKFAHLVRRPKPSGP